MAGGETKTNALRLLEKAGIPYNTHTYETNGTVPDGETVAMKIGQPPDKVFKTLVTTGDKKGPCVFVIPVCSELDLKAAARAAGEKSLGMLKPSDLERVTGYVRGGCSPFGMKKRFPTFVDSTARNQDTIIVSAGRIGLQAEIPPASLETLLQGLFVAVTETNG